MADRIQDLGVFTAYGEAREAGYEGSKAEFELGLKKSAEYAENAQASADDAELSAAGAAESAEDAETSAGEATQSATDAAVSAAAAADSATAAAASATQAASNAQAALGDIAPVFDATKPYNVGDYVIYTDGKLYRFITAHVAGSWTGADVVEVELAGEVSELATVKDITSSGATITVPSADDIYDIVLHGPETSLYDGMAVIDGVNIKVMSTNGQTEFDNYFMIGAGQIGKAYGNDFKASYLNTGSFVGGEWTTGRNNSTAIELAFLKTRCEYTVAAANAYLAEHPLIIWFKTDNFASAQAFYPVLSATGSNAYRAIGTMSAIAPLETGDSLSFATGGIARSDADVSIVTISEPLSVIPDGASVTSTGTLDLVTVSKMQDTIDGIKTDISDIQDDVETLQGQMGDKLTVVAPENTTFFKGVNYFNLEKAVFYSDRFIDSTTGIIRALVSAGGSVSFPVDPNTHYILYIPPESNRALVGESSTNNFLIGATLTIIYTAGHNPNNQIEFTTGSNAHYVFVYFSNAEYDYDNKKNSFVLNKDVYTGNISPFIGNENLPFGVANPLIGKQLLIFGDSITDTCNFTINSQDQTTEVVWKNPSNSYTPAGGTTIYFSMWPKILRDSQGFAEIRNYARSGASYKTSERTSGEERQNLQYQITVALNDRSNPNGAFEIDSFVPDIVIFALGTNDGAPNDTFESAMSKTVLEEDGYTIDVDATLAALDDTKFCESVRKAFLRIKQAFPMAQIYCSLPIQRANNDTNWGTLREYLSQMAQRYGCVIIDSTAGSGITREFNVWNAVGEYLKDGLHPNDRGQNLLARTILTSLKTHYIPFGIGFNPMS